MLQFLTQHPFRVPTGDSLNRPTMVLYNLLLKISSVFDEYRHIVFQKYIFEQKH